MVKDQWNCEALLENQTKILITDFDFNRHFFLIYNVE